MVNNKGGPKSSNDDVISAVDDFVWPMGSKHCNTNGRCMWITRMTMLKINLISSHSMRIPWSAYKLFSWPMYVSGYRLIDLSLLNELMIGRFIAHNKKKKGFITVYTLLI